MMISEIGYDNANYLVNCSQNLSPYANVCIHNSASYVTPNSSWINENSAKCKKAIACDSASYATSSSS
jgi:hypothetical protein